MHSTPPLSTTKTGCSNLRLCQTQRFSTLSRSTEDAARQEPSPPSNAKCLPVMPLADLLLHTHRGLTSAVRDRLIKHLQKHSYCVLTTSKDNRPAHIINKLRESLENDFFPDSPTVHSSSSRNRGNLQTSQSLYISERGVPMWKLGYEICEDQVREVFRLHAGEPDSHEVWPNPEARRHWLRGLALCRHICDQALDLVFDTEESDCGKTNGEKAASVPIAIQPAIPKRCKRFGSGGKSWSADAYCMSKEGMLKQRHGDFSVLYAMHYFNPTNDKNASQHATTVNNKSPEDDQVIISVKQHVDPSLFVLEPFLAEAEGLQVWDTHWNQWVTCDGPTSPIHSMLLGAAAQQHAMILFVGRAFCEHFLSVSPTLHRVIGSSQRRRTMIYEQKYEEFFPPPLLD